MAIQAQPSRIPEPFAGSGTKNTIPATNAAPSASQAASWASGFPPECSQPLSAGGCPVPRNDVNGALNQLSQDFAFRQDGGIWEWSALADYDVSRMVRGSDGKVYHSVQQSGPSVVAGAQDPTADDGTYWTAMPTDDADVVHITGSETVTGIKTLENEYLLTGVPIYNTAELTALMVKSPTVVKNQAPTDLSLLEIRFLDKDADGLSNTGLMGVVGQTRGSSGNSFVRLACANPFSDRDTDIDAVFAVGFTASNNQIIQTNVPRIDFVSTGAPSTLADLISLDKTFSCTRSFTNSGLPALVFGQDFFNTYPNSGAGVTTWSVVLYHWPDGTSTSIMLRDYGATDRVFVPAPDNKISLGKSWGRWTEVYAANGSIQTSDARLKTEPEEVPDAVLDAWGDVRFVQFKFKDAVERKGDAARIHSGMVAQRIDEAFKARGLDASRYGLFCFDEWEERPAELNEDGSVAVPALEAGSRYALRYDEALCMEAAYQRRRADRAEARLAALEERLAAIEAKLLNS